MNLFKFILPQSIFDFSYLFTSNLFKKFLGFCRELILAYVFGSSLIYAPADYASTGELIALSKIAAEYGGMYISHIRNEDSKVLDAIDELITISKQADIPAEIYHLKASREANWNLLDKMIEKVEKARAEGLKILISIVLVITAVKLFFDSLTSGSLF